MKVLLIYFTGTFNTRHLTKEIKSRFVKDGHSVKALEINKDLEPIDTSSYDVIGLGYPIYGFNSPKPFNEYLRKLSFKENTKYFIYKNSGESLKLNNSSSRVIYKILKKFNLTFIGEYHYLMPYNIRFPYDDDFIKEILIYDKKLMEIMFYNFNNNIIKTLPTNLINRVVSKALAIQKIGGPINSIFYKVDPNKCINCKQCIDLCPNHNIYFEDNKIKFHHNCDMCMRCSFYCPKDAIKIGILNKWKVHKYYNINDIDLTKDYKPYINENSKGFYKCFIETFKNIDKEYNEIFNNKSTN